MAFDSDTRNKLARMVAQARQLLTDEFTQQLQEIYGIQPDGAIVSAKKLTHLDDEEAGTAKFMRERIGHLVSGMTTEKKPVVAAIDRVVREQAFTILNRFAALRMCEERSLVEECVRAGMQSKGFKVYETIAESGLGDIYERYKTFLFCLFDEIAADLGILFDRFSSQGLLFPREQALLELFTIINNDDLSKLWAEDETIGWVYQYFNPTEERKAMRKASQAPRNSRELAVRNQFFTPRYVVEFLTDNTLGRIWYEMRRGDTALKEECLYLVWRPNEIFLAPSEKTPAETDDETDLSQEDLLKKTVYIEHRPMKDPRDLRVLDPACGSGHFLLYAFDLMERIYEEAWADPESPKSEITGGTLREEFETLEELRRAVPKLIIEHNLHGIDVDSRAVQIAALALWLRAQKTWKNLGIKAAERPLVTKSNIVTAEPMPGEENMRREFTAGLKPRVLGQLVDVVFDRMKLAGEAGSLLKIEEDIRDAVAEAKKQWQEGPKPEQAVLFPDLVKPKPEQQQLRFDLTGVTDERFWEQAENRILDALKEYAELAENGYAIRRRLFAEDAARGFSFIDLCRKRYDVVLMNPPFGESVAIASTYISHTVPYWCKNLASAFVGRLVTLITDNARIGTVIDRTVLIKSSYEDFRINYALGALTIGPLSDLGWGVLDANVEVSAAVFSKTAPPAAEAIFLDCREEQAKDSLLYELINSNDAHPKKRWLRPHLFVRLPNAAIAHDMPGFVIRWFNAFPLLKEGGAKALQGHAIKMDWYGRLRWEISPELVGSTSIWSNMYNGGSFSRFYLPLVEVVRWNHDGSFLKFHPSTRWSNAVSQQKPGIGYGKRGDILDAHIVPTGHVFTVEGLFVLPESISTAWYYLGILNSPLCSVILNYYCGQHKHAGYVDLLPIPAPDSSDEVKRRVSDIAREGWSLQRHLDTANEIAPFFVASWFHVFRGINGQFNMIQEHIASKCSTITRLVSELENCVEAVYGLNESERLMIADDLKKAFNDAGRSDKEEDSNVADTVDASSVAHDSMSYAVGLALGRWDIRIALDPSLAAKLPDHFDPLPVCPPGMLFGPDGLPADTGLIVSKEWLRARPDANTVPAEGVVKNPTISDSDYPLRISWNGILADDSGFNGGQSHQDDIVRRVREVLDLLWKDKTHDIEQEACDILGVSDLRDYFYRPSGFFQDHLKRYSKSRRKAPIYWPLSTKSGSYTLWIYYHRLTDQTLYACVNDYVNSKLNNISKDIARLREEVDKQGSTRNRQRLEQLMDFERELKDYRDELLRVAGLPYKPNLNDGVMITAAPLWKLFRQNQWRKDLEACWKNLQEGKYDWAHMANVIWPDRVKKGCRTDLSKAIAHDLEDLYEGDDTKPKRHRGEAKG